MRRHTQAKRWEQCNIDFVVLSDSEGEETDGICTIPDFTVLLDSEGEETQPDQEMGFVPYLIYCPLGF